MRLLVSGVTPEFIKCGDWKFDRCTGYEVDEQIGWGIDGIGSVLIAAERRKPTGMGS